MNITDYFSPDSGFFLIDEIFSGPRPWDALTRMDEMIKDFISNREGAGVDSLGASARLDIVRRPRSGGREAMLVVDSPMILEEEIVIPEHRIRIGAGTLLEPTAIIKPGCVIGEDCEIRQGAYLRGGVIVGDGCVIGHVTEVKNSIFMNRSNAGHFAYVGDAIIGSRVNLGAGTILANLQFRTRGEIDEERINEVVIQTGGKQVRTGRSKFGAVIGDYTEIGCNTVTSPGTLIGAQSWVYPNTTVPKGFYAPGSVLKNPGGDTVESSRKPVT
ncbi:MAG: hypothetical protein ACNS63_12980 [Candidatus Nitrospinota bacterium M3_3B_026]